MSYTPTQWSAGDTVTSAKLNKMEQGIANADGLNILMVNLTINNGIELLDKTWQEIFDADLAFVISKGESDKHINFIYNIKLSQNTYIVEVGSITFIATSANDYPSYTNDGGVK